MKQIFLNIGATLLAGSLLYIPAASGQGMGGGGMSPPINQIEAIEGHLQQSRTQASREVDEIAKKKPKAYEFAKPASNSPTTNQKPDSETGKAKASATTGMKNE